MVSPVVVTSPTILIAGNTPSIHKAFLFFNDFASSTAGKVNVALLPATSLIVPSFRIREVVAL